MARLRRPAALATAALILLGLSLPAAAKTVDKYVPVAPLVLPSSIQGVGSIAADADGNVYVGYNCCPAGTTWVAVFDRAGSFLRKWQVDDTAQALRPEIAVGVDGLVYVAPGMTGGAPIRVFKPDGTPVGELGVGVDIALPSDLEVDRAGNVYTTSRAGGTVKDDTIIRFDRAGKVTGRFAPLPGHPGALDNAIAGIAVAPGGSIYATMELGNANVADSFLLVHLNASGRNLRDAPPLAKIIENTIAEDVDFVGGRLYVAGRSSASRHGLFAFTPKGTDVAKIAGCCGHDVAVSGADVWVTGLEPSERRIRHVKRQQAPSLTALPAPVKRGGTITFAGSGFRPNASVSLHLGSASGKTFAAARTGAAGAFRLGYRIGPSWRPGSVTVVACQSGCSVKATAAIRVM